MCISVPARVVTRCGTEGSVDVLGNQIDVAFDLLPHAQPGDYVLLHAGFALQFVDSVAAEEGLTLVQQAGPGAPTRGEAP